MHKIVLLELHNYPVKTICMHGSPRNKFDNRRLWEQFNYHDFGIIGEPYFDVDFSKVFYLTDTGRRWDGYRVSVRDKIPVYQQQWEAQGLVFHKTNDIIAQLNNPNSPLCQSHYAMLITTHPQRWNPFGYRYVKEYCAQSVKNCVKRFLISERG